MVRWVRAGGALVVTTTLMFTALFGGGCDLDLKPYVEPAEGGLILRSDGGSEEDANTSAVDASTPTDTGAPDTAKPDVNVTPGVRRAFVTSRAFAGNLGGLQGADAQCKAAADAAVLKGNFVAWLSLNNAPAAARFQDVGPWVLLDNRTQVATNKAQLTSGQLTNAIRLDERGEPVVENVLAWTGTRANGQPGETCANFNALAATGDGTAGRLDQKNDQWTQFQQVNCQQALHLYCFEQ